MKGRAIFAISILSCMAGCKTSNDVSRKDIAASQGDANARFGIAVQSSGRVCLSIGNASLSPGAAVKLVYAESPQSTADAAVIGPAPACPPLEEGQATSYELRITQGHVQDNAEGIAVVGPATFSAGDGNSVIGRLDPGDSVVTFRTCESSEGVHLTVWSGTALQGERRWHGYHHLDYGVEPTCTEKETRP
jgi:hypothetical protein